MPYRLRTLMVWAALIPPLIAVAVLGLERYYFALTHRLSRMAEPNPYKSTSATPWASAVQDDDLQRESP